MNNRQKFSILYKARKKSKRGPNGCIEWTGNKTFDGYGIIEYTDEITKKRICLPIHRALFIINKNIELDRFDFVLHKCDNRSCINGAHLILGTPGDNTKDMIAKGRKPLMNGIKHKLHKRRTKKQIYIDTRGGIL